MAAYDPSIDTALLPHSGLAVGVGVQRLQDGFGLALEVKSPRFLQDRLAVTLAGGVGWHPDLRALPTDTEDQDFGAWLLYGHTRLLLEASVRIALGSGRLYAQLGPSALFLPERLSTTRVGLGVYGTVGAEIFAGDGLRAFPFAFFMELGASAHSGSADVENRTGPMGEVNESVDRPIGTGFVMYGGVRIYLWR